MSKSRLPERMVETILKNHKVAYLRSETGKHIKFTAQHAGLSRIIVVPGTLSDRRGALNLYADVRRALKGMGIDFVEDKTLTRG